MTKILVGGWPHKQVQQWAKEYGHLGSLYSPGKGIAKVLPRSLDNGRFSAWWNEREWSDQGFLAHCDKAMKLDIKPDWIVVPDVVCDKEETLRWWDMWEPILRDRYPNIDLAFVVQNGMTHRSIPDSANLIFIGGSMEWKRWAIKKFADRFPKIHVGRAGQPELFWYCVDAGVESLDSTGFFRDPSWDWGKNLHNYLRWAAGEIPKPIYRKTETLFDTWQFHHYEKEMA